MPLSVTVSHTVALTNDTEPHLRVDFGKTGTASECKLSLFVSLDIPCMPLSITADQAVQITNSVAPYLNVALGKTGTASDCTLSLFVSLDIPCMPFSIGPAWDQTDVPFGSNGLFNINLQLVKTNKQLRISGTLGITEDDCCTPTPWAPSIIGSTLTIANPIYLRSPKYFVPADLTYSLVVSDGAGDYYCGVKINVINGTIDPTLLISKTLSDVVYTSLAAAHADADYMRLLVCVVTYDAVNFTIKLRCINSVPELGNYA
jgi:hypothetical protein